MMDYAYRRLAMVALFLLLGACAAPIEIKPDATTTTVWPSPPADARVVFVRAISRPGDLGIVKGFFQRVVEFVFGETQAQLIRPMAVIDVDNILYVADPGAKGVHRFDRPAGRYDLIRGSGGTQLPSPVGLARGENGSVYVTDSALGDVFLIERNAKFAARVPLTAGLGQPTGIAFDATSRRLYVADTSGHRVNVYSTDGALLATIGRRGGGDGEFNFPTMIWRTATGKIFVTDSLNFRTQIFDANGGFTGKFGRAGDGSGDSPRQKGVATDRYGHVYVVDALLHGVQIFDESGSFLLSIGGLGQAPGEFRLPAGIFIGDDDTIYVADAYNQRVQVFRYVGGPT
jgi:DNA-binding beta-propeller fold protein YncE